MVVGPEKLMLGGDGKASFRFSARLAAMQIQKQALWTCPGLMDTPKGAKVRAIGVNSGVGTEVEAADVFSGVQG
jgi:hypothetical protein